MGLLKHLLFWPVTGPQFLIDFSLRRVDGVVREELTDDTAVKAELMELQLLLELGDIDDAEYERREAGLMLRLREIRDWRVQLGMGVSGGLVRVAGSGSSDEDSPGNAAAAAGAGAAPPAGAEDGTRDGDEPRSGGPAAGPGTADPQSASIDIHLDWE